MAVGVLAARDAVAAPGIDVQQFHPAITGDSYFGVDGAFVVPHLTLTAGVWLNWANQPLVVTRGNATGTVIGSQLGLDVALTLGIIDRLEVGLLLPAVFNFNRDNSLLRLQGGLDGNALGDFTLDIKGTLVDIASRAGTASAWRRRLPSPRPPATPRRSPARAAGRGGRG